MTTYRPFTMLECLSWQYGPDYETRDAAEMGLEALYAEGLIDHSDGAKVAPKGSKFAIMLVQWG
jgi:hypothetical protein